MMDQAFTPINYNTHSDKRNIKGVVCLGLHHDRPGKLRKELSPEDLMREALRGGVAEEHYFRLPRVEVGTLGVTLSGYLVNFLGINKERLKCRARVLVVKSIPSDSICQDTH